MFDPVLMPLSGVHSISASAGTGKTYTITTLYLRFLLESGCSTDEILVTTFTEAATAELRDRLRGRLTEALRVLRQYTTESNVELAVENKAEDAQLVAVLQRAGGWSSDRDVSDRVVERLEEALLSFDQAPVFTIHGFCSRILQELVFETGTRFNVDLVSSLDEWISEAVDDFAAQTWTVADSVMERWLPLDKALYGDLHKVAHVAMDSPSLEIVPGDEDLDTILDSDLPRQAGELFEMLGTKWPDERARVLELLETALAKGVLNGNSYGRPGQIDKAIRFIDQLADDRSLNAFTWEGTDEARKIKDVSQINLTTQKLTKGTVKKHEGSTPKHPLFDVLQQLAELSEQYSDYQQDVRSRLLSRVGRFVREHVAKRRGELGIMSFGDLLHRVDEALGGRQRELLVNALREKYRVALVDEFQDTDPVQYRIFSRVFRDVAANADLESASDWRESTSGTDADSEFLVDFYGDANSSGIRTLSEPSPSGEGSRAFIMIGDPKQSIYRFRGADLAAYLEAQDQTPPQNRHEMGMNWRSDRSLVKSVQAFFSSTSNPFLNQKIPLPPVEASFDDRFRSQSAFSVTVVPRVFQEDDPGRPMKAEYALEHSVQQLVNDIITQLRSDDGIETSSGEWRSIEPSDIAVLCQAGWQLREIQQALSARGVPSVLRNDESVFSTPEAESLRHILLAVESPASLSLMLNALQTPVFGQNAQELSTLRDDTDRLSLFVERFQQWHEYWQRDGFVVMWRRLLDEQKTIARLAGQITGERQITNYLHLGELLHRQATEAHCGPDELLQWFEHRLARKDTSDDEAMLRLETDSAAVQLCTIHKSKGLEYPIVYCPTLWSVKEWIEPTVVLSRSGSDGAMLEMPQIDVGSDLIRDRNQADERDAGSEDRRLLYVALTRARHQCHVYWATTRAASKSALGQILFGELEGKETDVEIDRKLRAWAKSLDFGGRDTGAADRFVLRMSDRRTVPRSDFRYQGISRRVRTLTSRQMRREQLPVRAQTSFTALAASTFGRVSDEIADLDSVDGSRSVSVDTGESDTTPLAGMPGGRLVGEVVHSVLEKAVRSNWFRDCQEPVDGHVRERVLESMNETLQPEMERMQLEPRWLAPLAKTLTTCVVEPLPVEEGSFNGPRLIEAGHDRLAAEVPFVHRLGSVTELDAGSDACRSGTFSTTKLAAAFRTSVDPRLQKYASRVENMSAPSLQGFLAGFVDLVFEWEGRWFIADYKTNVLGSSLFDYSRPSLHVAMAEHDYLLQASLYSVAICGMLAQRLPEFDIARDFGGVIYLFLRGLPLDGRIQHGVWHQRPDADFIRQLTAALEGDVAS